MGALVYCHSTVLSPPLAWLVSRGDRPAVPMYIRSTEPLYCSRRVCARGAEDGAAPGGRGPSLMKTSSSSSPRTGSSNASRGPFLA